MRGVLANGERLRRARIDRGLTQEQLAVTADVDVKTIRKAEQGGRLDVGTLFNLSRVLGIDPESAVQTLSVDADIRCSRLQIVEEWITAWHAHNLGDLLELHHEDSVLLLPGSPVIPFGGRFAGKQAIEDACRRAWQTIVTRPVKPGDYALVADDDTVVMHGTKYVRCADGRFAPLSSVHIYRFLDDRISELRVEYDTLAMLGMLTHVADRQKSC